MRLIAGLLVLLAVASAGCGNGEDDELDAPPGPLQMESCDGEVEEGASAADVRVEVHRDAVGGLARGEAVEWVLVLENTGDEPVRLVFFSGQQGDVVLSDDSGEVYRWSAARSFTQAIQCATLDAGSLASVILGDDILEINPGKYELEATVASRPAPEPVNMTVTVGS